MSESKDAYEKHSFIKKSIDLITAGSAWKGGYFHSDTQDIPSGISNSFSEERIRKIALEILLEGKVFVSVEVNDTDLTFEMSNDSDPKSEGIEVFEFTRSRSSFDTPGQPILSKIMSNLEAYEEALSLLDDPNNYKIIGTIKGTLHDVLGVQPILLDTGVADKQVTLALKAAAQQYKFVVSSLRQNIQYVFDQIGMEISRNTELDNVVWRWNDTWKPEAMCEFGPVYQIFLSEGIDLRKIKEDELGALQIAVENELMPRSAYKKCLETYS